MYNCELCGVTSAPKQPKLRWTIYQIDARGHQQIRREIAVCRKCLTNLEAKGDIREMETVTLRPPLPYSLRTAIDKPAPIGKSVVRGPWLPDFPRIPS